jgi:nitroreductase
MLVSLATFIADALLGSRYGGAEHPAPESWNAVLETMLGHRSVRNFRPEPVPDSVLAMVVAAAQSASTSSNLQCWSVIAVRDDERKARLSQLAGNQRSIREAPIFLVWLADLARNEAIGRAQDASLEGLHYLETLFVGIIDAALAAQNAAVAAESLGLGMCYIGAVRNHPEAIAAELGLPPRVLPVFGMCIGRPDPAKPAEIKPRLPQPAVLHLETYAAQPQAIETYEAAVKRIQQSEGQEAAGWIRRMLNRLASKESLNGRDRMREAIANLGFEIR